MSTPGYRSLIDDETELTVKPGNYCLELLLSQQAPQEPSTSSAYTPDPDPAAYPACMNILTAVMVCMWFYNMFLKFRGLCWSVWDALLTKKFTFSFRNGLSVDNAVPPPKPREPPDPIQKKLKHSLRRGRGLSRNKALMLAAFGLFSQMGSSAGLQLSSDLHQRKSLRKHRAYTGMLNTKSLDDTSMSRLRATLSINAESFYSEADANAMGALYSIVDTGCSHSCSNDLSDFEPGSLTTLAEPTHLGGIAGGLDIKQEGMLCWETLNDRGEVIQFRTKGYYIPELPSRLFSPQSFLAESERLDDHFRVWHNRSEWWVRKQKVMTINYDPATFLPRLTLFRQGTASKVLKSMAGIVTKETNQNLSPLRKLWLQWHFKLGHLGFEHVKWLGINGALGPQAQRMREDDTNVPLCGACQFGKQHRRPTGSKHVKSNPAKEGALKRDKLTPGELVFMDQLESRVRGRRMHTTGGEREIDKFCGSTIFCDAASHFISVQHQVNLTATETLKAKAMFERSADQYGVSVKAYHSDNGIFTAKDFVGELMEQGQGIRYSGVGAKHQNGQAENAIKIVASRARTMMIHASLHWPEVHEDSLWPMAVSYAADLYNHTPNKVSGVAPIEVFSGAKANHQLLRNTHT